MSSSAFDDPRFPLLWAEWAHKRQRVDDTRPSDAGYLDPDRDDYRDTDDPRYLNPAHPAVQAYLEEYRRSADRPVRPDDPERLRQRILSLLDEPRTRIDDDRRGTARQPGSRSRSE